MITNTGKICPSTSAVWQYQAMKGRVTIQGGDTWSNHHNCHTHPPSCLTAALKTGIVDIDCIYWSNFSRWIFFPNKLFLQLWQLFLHWLDCFNYFYGSITSSIEIGFLYSVARKTCRHRVIGIRSCWLQQQELEDALLAVNAILPPLQMASHSPRPNRLGTVQVRLFLSSTAPTRGLYSSLYQYIHTDKILQF